MPQFCLFLDIVQPTAILAKVRTERVLKSTIKLSEHDFQQSLEWIEKLQVPSWSQLPSRPGRVPANVLQPKFSRRNKKGVDMSPNLDSLSTRLYSDSIDMRRQKQAPHQLTSELDPPVHRIGIATF